MKTNARVGIFETNSSAVHQLVITKAAMGIPIYDGILVIKHSDGLNGGYWRDRQKINNTQLKLNYIVESLRCADYDNLDWGDIILAFISRIVKLKEMIENLGVKVEVDLKSFSDKNIPYTYCGDESCEAIANIIDSNDVDMLRRFLFSSDSFIATDDEGDYDDFDEYHDSKSPLVNDEDENVTKDFVVITSRV